MPTTKRQPNNRIGYGFDSHEFRAGISLKIGGVELSHDKGLGGHSDGDVLLHALTDALLGSIGAPDIGALFPPSNPKWKGADSRVFLREAMQRVKRAGYRVANVDSSLILAAPKIGPHSATIREHLAELLDIESECVGLKAKTPEGLNLENTAVAHVTVLLERGDAAKAHVSRKSGGRPHRKKK
ncbi:MAG TPA: 2-C-methyl-D-erythritol 2,4-cyclodiphosphate synthase [Candidatus Sulfotelmatobacter sp.]|nr:2-C-methyl-D-erythritol 2,4-cyclodiphosphate synthase [Candidatus Sulfotelmatobacter sp.]